MIFISNDIYLNTTPDAGNPLIGYHSILTISNVTADSSPDETPVINLVNEQTNQFWISDTLDEQHIYFSNDIAETINYIAIAKHNFGSAQIEWQLQGSNNGVSWTDLTESGIPTNDNAILVYFNDTNYLDYRLKLTAFSTDSDFPQIAHIKLGQILIMQRCIKAPHKSITLSRSTDIVTNTSEGGAFLGRIVKRQFLKTNYSFKNITPTFYRAYVDPFSIHAITGTFFVAWKPLTYPDEVGYGWTTDDITFNADNDNGMGTVDFDFEAVA